MLTNGGVNIVVDHNTVLENGNTTLYGDQNPTEQLVFTNNIVPDNNWAIMGSGTGPGNGTIAYYYPGGRFLGGVYAVGHASYYPAGNYYPASMADVGFVNLIGGNYRLSAASPYKGAATDGKDVGCDMDALAAATGTAY
jgi:hypothetical protein